MPGKKKTDLEEALSLVKWSGKINPDEVVIWYYDTKIKEHVKIPFNSILEIRHGMALILMDDYSTKEIPLHRFSKIVWNDKVLFRREIYFKE